MADLDGVLADLAAEGADLEQIVNGLDSTEWLKPTPAEGWTVATQIAHLMWTDEVSVLAATDADAFAEEVKKAWSNPTGFVDEEAHRLAQLPPAELLERWKASRAAIIDALSKVPAGTKLPWFGPPMAPASMATARIMETWAHAQDVADTFGVDREVTDRIKHVAHIGVRARNFAYMVNQAAPPSEEFRVELVSPTGELWTWGPEDAAQRVTGKALDFCLLVTQRRHLTDCDVTAVGDDAEHWLTIAQSFAGAPGTGREAGQFS